MQSERMSALRKPAFEVTQKIRARMTAVIDFPKLERLAFELPVTFVAAWATSEVRPGSSESLTNRPVESVINQNELTRPPSTIPIEMSALGTGARLESRTHPETLA